MCNIHFSTLSNPLLYMSQGTNNKRKRVNVDYCKDTDAHGRKRAKRDKPTNALLAAVTLEHDEARRVALHALERAVDAATVRVNAANEALREAQSALKSASDDLRLDAAWRRRELTMLLCRTADLLARTGVVIVPRSTEWLADGDRDDDNVEEGRENDEDDKGAGTYGDSVLLVPSAAVAAQFSAPCARRIVRLTVRQVAENLYVGRNRQYGDEDWDVEEGEGVCCEMRHTLNGVRIADLIADTTFAAADDVDMWETTESTELGSYRHERIRHTEAVAIFRLDRWPTWKALLDADARKDDYDQARDDMTWSQDLSFEAQCVEDDPTAADGEDAEAERILSARVVITVKEAE